MIFSRRERPPAEIVALLDRDERVVSWADVAGGGVVVATQRGLWWPFPDGPRRIGWEHIDKAVWRDDELTVVEASVVDELLLVDRPPVTVRLDVPRDLPPTVRKRVEASVLRSEVHAVPGGAARFVARRIPGRDGVTWWARLEPGTRDAPMVRTEVAARIGLLRAAWEQERPD